MQVKEYKKLKDIFSMFINSFNKEADNWYKN